MSKLLEYIKLLPVALANADKIVAGIVTNTKLKHGELPEDEQEEIMRRRIICEGCPFMSLNAVKEGTYNTKRTDKFCTACLCSIEYKTASLTSNCGLEKYNKRNPNNPLPLKWEAYKQKTDEKQDS